MLAPCKAVMYVAFYGRGGKLGARGGKIRLSTVFSVRLYYGCSERFVESLSWELNRFHISAQKYSSQVSLSTQNLKNQYPGSDMPGDLSPPLLNLTPV